MAVQLKEERLDKILKVIHQSGQVTVAELSRHFRISDVTIRRDLRELAARGLLRRAHGGALLAVPHPLEPPVLQRMSDECDAKERIGRAAADLIVDGESVFIGSGTTTAHIARHLVNRKNLTVVTNALNIATELATAEGVTVVVTGGMMRASELSLVGHIAEQSLREIRVDKVIIGIPAISLESGLTNDYLPEVMTDRAIIEMAPQLILVADHTKYNQVASAYVAPVERIATLVTDAETDPEILVRLREMNIRVIVVPETSPVVRTT